MMRVFSTAWVFAGCVLAACSGDGRGKADPNSDTNHANVTANNPILTGEICADNVEFCSRAQCRVCRYTDEVVADSGEWPVMRLGPEPVVAYFDDSNSELKVARRVAANDWQVETDVGAPELCRGQHPDGPRSGWLAVDHGER